MTAPHDHRRGEPEVDGVEPIDQPPPPYSDPPLGFWDSQPWRGAPPQPPAGPGPPPYELPPQGLGPEFHDLQAQRYDNHARVHEAMAWQHQHAGTDTAEALDANDRLVNPADKGQIERDLADLDMPPHVNDVFDVGRSNQPQQRMLYVPPEERMAANPPALQERLYHQQQTAWHQDQQRQWEAQAQYHRDQAAQIRDHPEWGEWQDFERTYQPQPISDPDALDDRVRTRRWPWSRRVDPVDTQERPQNPVVRLPHDDADRSAQALRAYADHQITRVNDYETFAQASRDQANAGEQFAQGDQQLAEDERREAQQIRDEVLQHLPEQYRDQARNTTFAAERQHLQSAEMYEDLARESRQTVGELRDQARWADGQVLGLRGRAQQNRILADQYQRAAGPRSGQQPAGAESWGATNIVEYDHAGIADGVGRLRRVVSRSQTALDRIGQTQASLAEGSAGQTVGASQEALNRLAHMHRRTIDTARRALDYLDLADGQMQRLDRELARRFHT